MPPRRVPLSRSAVLRVRAVQGLAAGRRRALKQVSTKTAAKKRERGAVVRAMFPEDEFHRCAVPDCTAEATDPHEPKLRSRGGSIVDPENIVGLCRKHHNWCHENPYAAGELGLMRHSWE